MRHVLWTRPWAAWRPGRWVSGLLFMSLLLEGGPGHPAWADRAVAAPIPGTLTFQDGKLTARLIAAPLRQVMAEVSQLSGAEIRWLSPAGEAPVSVAFTALPFPEALRRILREQNFLLVSSARGQEGRPVRIWITSRSPEGGLPTRQSPSQPAATLAPRSTADPAPQSAETPTTELEALDAAPLETVIQTVLRAEDLSVRLEAIARLRQEAQENPQAREVLTHIARNDPNPQVRDAAAEGLRELE
jgi:hypothetical protein